MGMMTKSGKYFANPAIGRASESAGGGSKREGAKPGAEREQPEKREPEATGGAHSVHIFRDEAGGHHVAAHHPHGVEHSEHGSLDEAVNHAKAEMGGEGDEQAEGEQGGGAPEAGGLMGTLGGGGY